MEKVTGIFDERTRHLLGGAGKAPDQDNHPLPWKVVAQNASPPLLFGLLFADGRRTSFAYSDLRELRSPDAGRIELGLLGMAKYVVTLEGRHLHELLKLFESHQVSRVQESDPRETDRPEKAPEIVKISITELVD